MRTKSNSKDAVFVTLKQSLVQLVGIAKGATSLSGTTSWLVYWLLFVPIFISFSILLLLLTSLITKDKWSESLNPFLKLKRLKVKVITSFKSKDCDGAVEFNSIDLSLHFSSVIIQGFKKLISYKDNQNT